MGRFAATEFWKINWTFQGAHCFVQIELIAMNKAIAGNIQIDLIRAITGVTIRQLLISIVGFGALSELYAANCLMKRA